MPFSPLPKTFLEDLHSRRLGRVVELGCGDGQFTALLKAEGASPLCVDRSPRVSGSVADLVADALELPLKPGSVQFLVAANLLRHLWPLPTLAPVPAAWLNCLAPGARLYILEDEPAGDPPAARNYRDLQAFLARVVLSGRGPLLPRMAFEAALAEAPASRHPGRWILASQENRWPVNTKAVLTMLAGDKERSAGDADRLMRSITRHGLSYGTYWWACWQNGAV